MYFSLSLGVRGKGEGGFLPFYKANYIGLKTRDRHARQDTPCSRWRFRELAGRE